MILDKCIKVAMYGNAIKYYRDKGYGVKHGDKIDILIKDLNPNSHARVHVKCDGDNCNHVSYITYQSYLKSLHGNKHYCEKCSARLFRGPQKVKNILNLGKTISFAEWGIQNICSDFVEKYWSKNNKISPYNITYGSNKKILLNCVKTEYHGSYFISPSEFVSGNRCPYCGRRKVHPKDSFGQYLIDNFGFNAIDKYWCKENIIDPFTLYKSSASSVVLQCQNVGYHHYKTTCFDFYNGRRCGMCHGKQLHPLDSFGATYPDKLNLWSDKNDKSPFEHYKLSHANVFWKCENGKHEDYQRIIQSEVVYGFRCPECVRERDESMIQEKVRSYIENTYPQYKLLHEYNCTLMPCNPKKKGSQGAMPFDNELIIEDRHCIFEIHGIQHYMICGFQELQARAHNTTTKFEFHKQQLYDRYKKYVAYCNGYFYMAIPYWEIENSDNYKKLIDNKIIEILSFNKNTKST